MDARKLFATLVQKSNALNFKGNPIFDTKSQSDEIFNVFTVIPRFWMLTGDMRHFIKCS